MNCYAVLIDIVGIQQYLFGSNKLKENLGASYIVQEVYKKPLQDALKATMPNINETDLDLWRTEPDYIAIKNGRPFEIAYIGGGNAMLFFKEQAQAESFVRQWTKKLLLDFPGLNTAIAIREFEIDDFISSKKQLFNDLAENKYKYTPVTIIPRHGITAECSHSGYSADVYAPSEGNFISSVINAKISNSKEAENKFYDLFKDELGAEYYFTDDLGKLGQLERQDSHIAIVHIDGNSMADRFAGQGSLDKLRKLSISVEKATISSVKAMINAIKENKDMLLDFLGRKSFCKPGSKEILPFRPIIIGGDDITFVSEGRLGIWLAEQFLKAFQGQTVSDGKQIDACAGVAITKTKYPFYRGYSLSEQLCKNAKEKRKSNGSKGSWIDFHISFGGISGTLQQIRDVQYKATQGSLLMRPYCLKSDKPEHDFSALVENTKILSLLPNNKIKDMRLILTLGKDQTKIFIDEIKARGDADKIPKIQGRQFEISLFENSVTPYFDMIELMELYPGLKEVKR